MKTQIIKTEKGHQVGFTIGHQTFFLEELLSEEGMTSLQYAEWQEKQLKSAIENLKNKLFLPKCKIKNK